MNWFKWKNEIVCDFFFFNAFHRIFVKMKGFLFDFFNHILHNANGYIQKQLLNKTNYCKDFLKSVFTLSNRINRVMMAIVSEEAKDDFKNIFAVGVFLQNMDAAIHVSWIWNGNEQEYLLRLDSCILIQIHIRCTKRVFGTRAVARRFPSSVVHIYVTHSTKIYTYSVKHTMVYSTTGFMVLLKSLFALGYESTLSDSKYAVNARIIFSCCISYFNWQFVLQFNPTVPPEQYSYQ